MSRVGVCVSLLLLIQIRDGATSVKVWGMRETSSSRVLEGNEWITVKITHLGNGK
jgi:hypothetical protein